MFFYPIVWSRANGGLASDDANPASHVSDAKEQQKKGTRWVFMSSACAVRVEPHSLEPTGDLPIELNRGPSYLPRSLISSMVIANFQSRLFASSGETPPPPRRWQPVHLDFPSKLKRKRKEKTKKE